MKIGDFKQIYLSSDARQPKWALVQTCLFGAKLHFGPIELWVDDRDDLRVPIAKDRLGAMGVERVPAATDTAAGSVPLKPHRSRHH